MSTKFKVTVCKPGLQRCEDAEFFDIQVVLDKVRHLMEIGYGPVTVEPVPNPPHRY